MLKKLIMLLLVLIAVTTNVSASDYIDGTYKATYDFTDGHGWKPFLEIKIKKGKIKNAKYDFINAEGMLKSKNKEYEKLMKKITNGMYPKKYMKKLKSSLLDKQNSDVDIIAGATHSSKTFKILSKTILNKAEKGDLSVSVLAMNTTYSATEKEPDKAGYKAKVSIAIEDNKIIKVEYTETNEETKKVITSKDIKAIAQLEAALLKSQDPYKLSYSKNYGSKYKRFIKLAKEAIDIRQ